jgi:hypothetical protein
MIIVLESKFISRQYLRLNIWRDESVIALKYKKFLLIINTSMLSLTIKQNNINQKLHNEYFMKFDCVVFVDLKIAKKEIVKKK